MLVDPATLLRLALLPEYTWMASLRCLRTYARPGKRSCCRRRARPAQIPDAVFAEVASDPRLATDLLRYKTMIGVRELVVRLPGLSTVL